MPKLKIFLADDHAIVREGLKRLIDVESDMSVTGESAGGPEVVAEITQSLPDVVVIDISMPGLNGLEITRQLKASSPSVKVLVHEPRRAKQVLLQETRFIVSQLYS